MVRKATTDDIDKLLSWSKLFHAASPYNTIEFDDEAITKVLLGLLTIGVVFVNEDGFVAGTLVPLMFNPSKVISVEMAWYCPGGNGKELRKAFEDWSQEQGALGVQFSTLNNKYLSSLGDHLIQEGYSPIEVAYIKEFR